MPPEKNEFRRITEDMKDAGQREDGVEIEKQSRERNEKHLGTETSDCPDHFGEKSDQEKQRRNHVAIVVDEALETRARNGESLTNEEWLYRFELVMFGA